MKPSLAVVKNILREEAEERDGILYLGTPPNDLRPSTDINASDEKKWSAWRTENFTFFAQHILPAESNALILDLGAGQGDFNKLFENKTVVPVDIFPYPGVLLVANFTRGLPFKDHSADIIMLSNVLEHIATPETFIRECLRVLKPGGKLLIAVPFLINVHQRPYDFFRYTDIALEKILRDAKFSDIHIQPIVNLITLSYNVLAQLFISLIKKTSLHSNNVLNVLMVFFFRVYWFFVRVTLFGFLKLFRITAAPHADYPLGYHVVASK